jgi:hypothetical protein
MCRRMTKCWVRLFLMVAVASGASCLVADALSPATSPWLAMARAWMAFPPPVATVHAPFKFVVLRKRCSMNEIGYSFI